MGVFFIFFSIKTTLILFQQKAKNMVYRYFYNVFLNRFLLQKHRLAADPSSMSGQKSDPHKKIINLAEKQNGQLFAYNLISAVFR